MLRASTRSGPSMSTLSSTERQLLATPLLVCLNSYLRTKTVFGRKDERQHKLYSRA
jgi:hypothetical protein